MFFSAIFNANYLQEGSVFVLTQLKGWMLVQKWYTAIITFNANSNYPVQATSLPHFLMHISFVMPNGILRKLVMTFDNVVAFNRKILFSVFYFLLSHATCHWDRWLSWLLDTEDSPAGSYYKKKWSLAVSFVHKLDICMDWHYQHCLRCLDLFWEHEGRIQILFIWF